jgi:hypothetical protein
VLLPASSARTSVWRYYRFATLAALVVYGLVAVYAAAIHDFGALAIVALLAVVEISLSFDNALVNSIYVQRLSPEWQVRFLRYGILIAVVGMRLLFPIIVVSLSNLVNPVHVVVTAFTNERAYAASLQGGHIPLVVFGGVYLLQIFLNFFLGAEKDVTWLVWLERPLERVGKMTEAIELIVSGTAAVAVGILAAVWSAHAVSVVVAGASSIALFQLIGYAGSKLEGESEEKEAGTQSTKTQLRNLTGRAAAFTFLYLELQDAMFSFDGVLGAFAFTLLMVLVMAGLGIGALFVRSMTIHLVDTGALAKLRYLGNGAFWAIGFLPFSMWFGFPAYVTGGVSVLLILAAVGHSGLANRSEGLGFFSATGEVAST